MNRRELLAMGSASLCFGMSGCIEGNQSADGGENGGDNVCPRCPDITLENSVSYEAHDVSLDIEGRTWRAASLITSEDDIEDVTSEDSDPPETLRNIDFDEEFGIAVQVETATTEKVFRLLGVDREDSSLLNVHVCGLIFNDLGDNGSLYEQLLISPHDGNIPDEVELETYRPPPPAVNANATTDRCL